MPSITVASGPSNPEQDALDEALRADLAAEEAALALPVDLDLPEAVEPEPADAPQEPAQQQEAPEPQDEPQDAAPAGLVLSAGPVEPKPQ